jgi:hypothetical protein
MHYIEGIRMAVELFGWMAGGLYIAYGIEQLVKKTRKAHRRKRRQAA